MEVLREPCTSLFVAMTGVGKTHLCLDLIENEYNNYFEYVVVICPTLYYNKTYLDRKWFWKDDNIILIDSFNDLNKILDMIGQILSGYSTLFILDDCISSKDFNKRRCPLINLATSGRHRIHSLWILTQSYSAVPKDIRRQAKQLFVWKLKEKSDVKLIDEETNCIDSMSSAIKELGKSNRTFLFVRFGYPDYWRIVDRN